jgi:hypothetical protein
LKRKCSIVPRLEPEVTSSAPNIGAISVSMKRAERIEPTFAASFCRKTAVKRVSPASAPCSNTTSASERPNCGRTL